MSDRVSTIEQKLRNTSDQSAGTVRRAHDRAARPAHMLRLSMQHLHTRDDASPGSCATALRLAFDEHERSAREKERFLALADAASRREK